MDLDYDLKSIQEMREAVRRSKEAQSKFLEFSQEQVDRIVKYVADSAYRESESLARLAVEETRMGITEHKKIKNELCSRDVYQSIKDEKTVGIIREDHEKKVMEIAYPFGVIAGIIPTTNPTSTAIFKTLISLKSRNAIVFSPHPSAVKCTVEALKICSKAAAEAGAPEGLIGWITKPTMETTVELMKHKDVHLILATGGGGLVRAAYSSGKPAYGVGPGNVPVYVEKTTDVKQAVKMIVDSKTFDNGTICASEQAIVVDQNIKTMAIRELKNNGAYFLNEIEKTRLESVISPIKGRLNPAIVGRSAKTIAEMAGINIPDGTRLLIAEEHRIGKDVPLSIEKLAPILGLYTANSLEEAKKTCMELLNLGGRGHSLSLHTKDERVVLTFGIEMPVSRILVNTLSSIGAAGATTGLTPSMTLGCGSYGGNITSDNITARHLINIKRVAYGVRNVSIPNSSQHGDDRAVKYSNFDRVETIIEQVLRGVEMKSGTIHPDLVSNLVKNVIEQYQNNK
ncbi:acetaldehyde dehydrogenase (acetylating) [Aneurinibacillus sp. Ricciae_BoGa-3]|uniref:acetaldehyde dehydrogenase (acetylating) n=1 Tax=Aneurinibacillus sp. Ricciae_BoGa-3 TaxID=3022697 RepID=UPI002340BA4C|nr:acetaldehyde dehydrogenase (acetylating) [Aneurinibacillus sp. Ricciae_BoGa-3]WCK56815.1 acetaldehyde dehydrogenase (acetylating) [Aneurinibacillus sp. Ricciae_BoGa-3]